MLRDAASRERDVRGTFATTMTVYYDDTPIVCARLVTRMHKGRGGSRGGMKKSMTEDEDVY